MRSTIIILVALLVLVAGALIAWLSLGLGLEAPPLPAAPVETGPPPGESTTRPAAAAREPVVVERGTVQPARPEVEEPQPVAETPESVGAGESPVADMPSFVDRISSRLLAFQDGDGGWRANDPAWGRRGATALSVLFLLGRGTQIGEGADGEALARGLEFLRSAQPEDAPLSTAAAALALSEANVFAGTPELQAQLRESARVSLRELMGAAREDGGWSGWDPGTSETLASGLAVMALKSAAVTDLTRMTDEKTAAVYEGASAWFDARAASQAALPPGGTVESETLDASITMISNFFLGAKRGDERLANAARVLAASPYDRTSPLQSYFATMSLFQYGGEPWKEWSKRLKEQLDAASLPTDPAEAALLGLSAEIYYRYQRVQR